MSTSDFVVLSKADRAAIQSINWWHRIRLPDGSVTPGRCPYGKDTGDNYFSHRFGMPESLKGLSVLDIGAWDGLFSFEAERRGASRVVAVNTEFNDFGSRPQPNGLEVAKRILQSDVQHVISSVYDLPDKINERFDVVLLYGVLYHLKSPYLALEQAYAFCNQYALIETACCMLDEPVWEIRPNYNNNRSNLFYPSPSGLEQSLRAVGFRQVELLNIYQRQRITVRAIR